MWADDGEEIQSEKREEKFKEIKKRRWIAYNI